MDSAPLAERIGPLLHQKLLRTLDEMEAAADTLDSDSAPGWMLDPQERVMVAQTLASELAQAVARAIEACERYAAQEGDLYGDLMFEAALRALAET